MNNTYNTQGDASFSGDFRNLANLTGGVPNEASSIAEKFILIAEQRERILESFYAEHAGIKPSQIRQVVTELPDGDVAWHLEVM
jgi:hypothetical protein